MNYIGSKHRLSDFIRSAIHDVAGKDLSRMVFCDLFAGTGIVGRKMKADVKQVISNDLEYYSFVLNKNYIENNVPMNGQPYLDALNALEGKNGIVFEEYSENGSAGRLYFSESNGRKIDAARQQIGQWKDSGEIAHAMYYFLLASLLESADKVANTASVYGAFLKKIKKSAQKELIIEPATYECTASKNNAVHNEDSNQLIRKIKGDILYLDPPYNHREYGANYHLLNTIALYDDFKPKGVTGLREYRRSDYCKKNAVEASFEELINNADFRYIFFSYNNEGLMPPDTIREIMERYGQYRLFLTDYQRFKADKDENRNHKATATREYLHVLIKTEINGD